MQSVFSFNAISDLDMGVMVEEITRSIKPKKRVIKTIIAGRSGAYEYTANAYNNTEIEMDCMYVGNDPVNFARNLSYWLKDTGSLVMADEPDKTYTATAWVDIPEDYVFTLRHFTITFDCQPFARSAPSQKQATITQSGQVVQLNVQGTAPTPCRITITNTGLTTINNIKLTHSVVQ